MWKLSTVFLIAAAVSAAASSNAVVISSYDNGVVQWEDTSTTGVYHVEWTSELTGTWTNSWNSLRDLAATGGMMQASVPMFFRVVHSIPPSLFEDFEDAGGWTDHPAGADWTEHADSGTWTTVVPGGTPGTFMFARSDCMNAHSGQRYIGMDTNFQGNITGVLKLPPVDNPDEVTYWVKGTAPEGVRSGEVHIQVSPDEFVWVPIHIAEVTSSSYVKVTVIPPSTTRLRIAIELEPGYAVYVDDVTVAP